MVSDKKLTNAVGGRSTRACDNCVKKRARWFCGADDAFLCQSCDSSVHSANPLARRHKRVRLRTTAVCSLNDGSKAGLQISAPSWHQGFARKPRTPRKRKNHGNGKFGSRMVCDDINRLRWVPEISGEEQSNEEIEEEQLIFRVPVLDPFSAELCSSDDTVLNAKGSGFESKTSSPNEMKDLQRFLPSDRDFEEFEADFESLLGGGFEDEQIDMEGLGIFVDCDDSRVKTEEEDQGNNQIELKFENDSAVPCEEEDNKSPTTCKNHSRKTFLRLDYERVLSAWDSRKSPWTTGQRPRLNPDDCWPDISGTFGGLMNGYGEMGVMGGHGTTATAARGREARVSRYREKRRKRLFAKKIRYEVRKLNAEKRPRIKGRFVKRACPH